MSITENVKTVKQRVAEAAVRSGRAPEEVRLCAATKMNDAPRVREAVEAGVDICGENRVQELTEKYEQGAYTGCPLHFIGHLQKNKVKYLIGKVQLIESVDCVELLEAIDKKAKSMGIVQDVLLEVNIGGEAAKSGFAPDELEQYLPQMAQFSAVRVRSASLSFSKAGIVVRMLLNRLMKPLNTGQSRVNTYTSTIRRAVSILKPSTQSRKIMPIIPAAATE